MSLYKDWDVVYVQTYEALNRKLGQLFYQQRDDKYLVKQLVAIMLDQEIQTGAYEGLTGGFDTQIVIPGSYSTDPNLAPTVEVAYADSGLRTSQQKAAVRPTADLDSAGRVIGLKNTLPSSLLYYPPAVTVRPHKDDTTATPAVVLTSLKVGGRPPQETGTLGEVLKKWLLGSSTPSQQPSLLQALDQHLNKKQPTWNFKTYKEQVDKVLNLYSDKPLSLFFGALLAQLLDSVWQACPFWQSPGLARV